MDTRTDVLLAILLLGIASYACRAGGFFMMRYVAITPRVEAGLRAVPVALVGAILGPIAARGGPPEWAGLAVAMLGMRLTGNELLSALAAVAIVAGGRSLGLG